MFFSIFIGIIIVSWSGFATAPNNGPFDCGSGPCINQTLNRHRRQTACRSDQWQCQNGYCVSLDRVCNKMADCPDNSDESPTICKRKKRAGSNACVLPPFPEHGIYEVEDIPEAKPGEAYASFVLTIRCRRGYGVVDLYGDGSGIQQVYCVNGKWRQNMPRCVRFCKLDPDPSIRYTCFAPGTGTTTCRNYVSPGTTVDPECNTPLYYSTEVFRSMMCISGVWTYYAQCKAECGRITPGGKPLLIGGKEAKRGELPWHAAIYRKVSDVFMQICGGSLVSNNVVISAAHCFWTDVTKLQPASKFGVAMGKLHRDWDSEEDVDAQKSLVKEIKIEKLFEGVSANYQEDIAILIMATPFTYTTYIRPVCIDFNVNFESWQLQHGVLGKVAGWGFTAATGQPAETLKVVRLPFIKVDTCLETLPETFREYVTGDKFCAGYTNGTAVCQGDSGGGLAFPSQVMGIDRYYLRGIVSTAPQDSNKVCNAFAYTTFTRISKHQKLIVDALAESDRRICPLYSFQCDDGSCVDPGADCNGRQDCADGSDESDELCRVKPLMAIKPPTQPDANFECGKTVEVTSLIVGGNDFRRGDIPWLIDIYKRGDETNFLCSGTLISNKHVLTIAHAFTLGSDTPSNLQKRIMLRFGTFDRSDWADVNVIRRILKSIDIIDSFNKTTFANDLAILTLDNTVTFNNYIRPICLWFESKFEANYGLFAGWGKVDKPDILRLNIVNTAACRAANRDLIPVTSNKTVCAANPNGPNPCVGFSGGGLYVQNGGKWYLRGLLSVALRSQNEPQLCKGYIVFTDVWQYLPWIRKVVTQ